MDDFKDSFKKAINERLSGPLFGYVTLSLIFFNWRPLAFLFMSKTPVEERIRLIDSEATLNWSLWLPLLLGTVIAIGTPYLNYGLEKIHKRARDWRVHDANESMKAELKQERLIAKDRAIAKYAEDIESKRQEARAAVLDGRRLKIISGIAEYESKAKELNEENETVRKNNLMCNKIRREVDLAATQVLKAIGFMHPTTEGNNITIAKDMIVHAKKELEKLDWFDEYGRLKEDPFRIMYEDINDKNLDGKSLQ